MFVLARALTYATLFIGLVLIFLPARIFSSTGLVQPAAIGGWQLAGMTVGAAGAALALWCILTFVFVGHGTPAPFDPPRRLVIQGPYRFVRNPMYIGAGLALAGGALFYQSLALFSYTGFFFLGTHLFVVMYEEPTLRQSFGRDDEAYWRRVGRWWPRRPKGRILSPFSEVSDDGPSKPRPIRPEKKSLRANMTPCKMKSFGRSWLSVGTGGCK